MTKNLPRSIYIRDMPVLRIRRSGSEMFPCDSVSVSYVSIISLILKISQLKIKRVITQVYTYSQSREMTERRQLMTKQLTNFGVPIVHAR